MGTSAPRELSTLCIGHGDGLRRRAEAVPDFLKQLQSISDGERSDVLGHCAHGRILRLSVCERKAHISTDRQYDFRAMRLTSGAQRGLASNGQSRPVLLAHHERGGQP